MTAPGWRAWPGILWTVGRTYGARGALLRGSHELRRAAGRFRHIPRHRVVRDPAPALTVLCPGRQQLERATDVEAAVRRADRVVAGEFQAFRHEWRSLDHSGTLPQAGVPPFHDADSQLPWWRVTHLAPGRDIKDAWEPARFGWAYDLVRAFVLTGDRRYPAAFADILARWITRNPPFYGVNWSCGQETAIRAVALLVARAAFGAEQALEPAALRRIDQLLGQSGERIADAIGYAVSQRNNHALSEAVGLIAVGAHLHGVHPHASHWLRTGVAVLERAIRGQFARDGWYIQHSFSYTRLALEQCIVAERAMHCRGLQLSAEATARLRAATELLLAVVNPATGALPNHGANDGAFVLPITLASYRDFRPVLTAASASFGVPYPADMALDAEVLAWLDVPPPERGAPAADGVRHGSSGWTAARLDGASVFLRAPSYTSRPSHLDALHADVSFGAQEVVVDPGTFSYNAPAPWNNTLTAAAVHNGPVLDDAEPGLRGPRFLWYRWPDARLIAAASQGGTAAIVAEMPGRVRREVRVARDLVRVEDTVLASDARRMRVRWLLHPGADSSQLRVVEGGARVLEAREGAVPGWFSPHYGERIPSRYIEAERDAVPGARIVTEIVPR